MVSSPAKAPSSGRSQLGRRRHRRSTKSDLGSTDDPGPLEQLGPVAAQLVHEHARTARPAAGLSTTARSSEQQQDPGPLDVAQEPVAEAAPSAAPSIRPGMSATTNSVSSPGRPATHHAEMGLERGERIVGDLRARRRDAAR